MYPRIYGELLIPAIDRRIKARAVELSPFKHNRIPIANFDDDDLRIMLIE